MESNKCYVFGFFPWLPSTEMPVIEMDLAVKSGMIVRAGTTLLIPAKVTGKPYPFISWTKDDGKLDKDRVEVLTEGENSIISVQNCQRKDCGKYTISACNPSGIKNVSARVEVVGEWKSTKSVVDDKT